IKYKLMECRLHVDVITNQFQMERSTHLLDPYTVVIGISSSGFHQTILTYFDTAKNIGSTLIGITCQQDSPITECADMSFFIPSDEEGSTKSVIEISIFYLLDSILKEMH